MEYFGRLLYKHFCTMLQQKLPAAESPQHGYAGQTGIFGCLKVYIGVAHIDGILGIGPHFR